MKILKKGSLVKRVFIFECGDCGCVFEADENECNQFIGNYNPNELITTHKCPTEACFSVCEGRVKKYEE